MSTRRVQVHDTFYDCTKSRGNGAAFQSHAFPRPCVYLYVVILVPEINHQAEYNNNNNRAQFICSGPARNARTPFPSFFNYTHATDCVNDMSSRQLPTKKLK